MLSEKDIGKRVHHENGAQGVVVRLGGQIRVEVTPAPLSGPWDLCDGWTLDEPAAEPASVAQRPGEDFAHARCTAEVVGIRCDLPSGHEGSHVMPPIGKAAVKEWLDNLPPGWREVYEHIKARDPKGQRRSAPAARDAERESAEGPTEGMVARLRRWSSDNGPDGVTMATLRALLSEAADEIERLAEEQRKIIDLCGRGGDAGVTALQAVAQMRERLDAVEESAEAARAEWLDRDLGE